MKNKQIIGILLGPAVLLLGPLIAMQFTDEVAWSFGDFAIAWVLMASVGFAYKLATRRTGNIAYRAAVGLALATVFFLIWINLAVGLIGSEDNPANRLFLGVLVVGIVGAVIARFEPQSMVRVLIATALVQLLVPIVALIVWQPGFTLEMAKTFTLNACFVLLFLGSAWLFRRSAAPHHGLAEGKPA